MENNPDSAFSPALDSTLTGNEPMTFVNFKVWLQARAAELLNDSTVTKESAIHEIMLGLERVI